MLHPGNVHWLLCLRVVIHAYHSYVIATHMFDGNMRCASWLSFHVHGGVVQIDCTLIVHVMWRGDAIKRCHDADTSTRVAM